jgi:hypothetical protein
MNDGRTFPRTEGVPDLPRPRAVFAEGEIRRTVGAGLAQPASLSSARIRALVREHGFGLDDDDETLLASDRFHSTRPLEFAKAWIGSGVAGVQIVHPVMVQLGDRGTGKSFACTWATIQRADEGPLRYVLEDTVARWFASSGRDHERDWQALLDAATLFVDDLGGAPSNRLEHARLGVSQLVLERQGRGRRTILAGSLDREAFAERSCPRLLDRLAKSGHVEHFDGPSLRGQP